MKSYLVVSFLLASVVGMESRVQVSRQNSSLLISAPVLPVGQKYTECWLESMPDASVETLSANSWRIIVPDESGIVTLVVCTDTGSCNLIEVPFDLSRGPPLWTVVLIALGCGGLMNFMPCVLPVIGLKLRAFSEPRKRAGYTAGVLCSFMVLATLSLTLGTGLSLMGFGHYRLTLCLICFLMATHLLHMWQMPSFGVSGNYGPFGMGILTVALGSSCAVPFLAPVMAYSLTASVLETYLLFAALGVGFCSPFFLPLSGIMGNLRHYLPVFEVACGVALLLVSGWIATTLPDGHVWPTFMLAGAVLLLLILRGKFSAYVMWHWKFWCLVIVRFLAGGLVAVALVVLIRTDVSTDTDVEIPSDGPRVIFVTAEWCMNCHAMYPTITDSRVVDYCDANDIPIVVLDYTNRSKSVGKFLSHVTPGFSDVPVLLVVSPDGIMTVLTGLWTTDQVIQSLDTSP